MDYTLNCHGRVLNMAEPQVMGILNATPDSFYADSRQQTETAIAERTGQILAEGATIIDVGACSTRPGGEAVDEAEELRRLRQALAVVRRQAPETIVSVDTFRPTVARAAVEEFGADIINDVGAPASDGHDRHDTQNAMFRMVTRLRVPYIYTSHKANIRDILLDCSQAINTLCSLGQKDIILDPGFGFGKTLEQNYRIMAELDRMQMTARPILVGISRKSMICRLLNQQPQQALNGTTVLNTIALLKGASILRVHDVRQAVECIRLTAEVQTAPIPREANQS